VPLVGLNVHEATDGDLLRLKDLPTGTPVRTTDYGDAESDLRVGALRVRRGWHPLVVTYSALPQSWIDVIYQIGNEPDTADVALDSATRYGKSVGQELARYAAAGDVVRPTVVTAGFSNGASEQYVVDALIAGAADADAVCFHVYGDDLRAAVAARYQVMRIAMKRAGCTRPLWVTEIGFPSLDPARQRDQLAKLRDIITNYPAIERWYIYALATDEKSDFYGVCKHDAARTPLPAWAAVRALTQPETPR
jgi:hypothetical protein